MKRDVIVGKLIAEGLSEKTLVRLNDKQLISLAERMLSEQVTKGNVVMSKASNSVDVKKLTDQGLNVELREKKKEVKEQGTKLGSTPGLGDNPGSTELDNVTVTAKKTPTVQKSPNSTSKKINPQINPNTSQPEGQSLSAMRTSCSTKLVTFQGL